jgi:hypothetical protein
MALHILTHRVVSGSTSRKSQTIIQGQTVFPGFNTIQKYKNRYIIAKILSLGVYINAAGASACITYEHKMLLVLLFKFARYFHNCFCVEMIAG